MGFRRRTFVGRAARRRVRRGGPRAIGRPAATAAEWSQIREAVLARARWGCQACGSRARLDVHHVVKRAQGGSDFDLDQLIALCRACHDRTDAPYIRGRLVVTPLGAGRFAFALVRGVGKGAGEVLDRWESREAPTPSEEEARAAGFAHVGKPEGADGRSPGLAPSPAGGRRHVSCAGWLPGRNVREGGGRSRR